jgi:hypothetical protein
MKRRELFRRTLTVLGAAAVPSASREFPPNYDASKALQSPDWKPSFLDAHQDATLIALSDLIIPATDTPGAKEALTNRFIDSLLAVETREAQRDFLNALAFLDGEALQRYRTAFVHLTPEQQLELLSYLAYPQSLETWHSVKGDDAAHQHFLTLKDWIARAYYSSEAGMRELGWDGEAPHGEFTGCAAPSAKPAEHQHQNP